MTEKTRLEEVFNMPSKTSPNLKKDGTETKEVEDILKVNHDLPIPTDGKVDVTVDAKKAGKLNEFIQTRLTHIYELAESAAAILVRDIQHGDIDARSMEATARLLETAIRALTEMNQFNMFLQKKIGDEGLRREMEKLHESAQGNRLVLNREQLLSLANEIAAEKPIEMKIIESPEKPKDVD